MTAKVQKLLFVDTNIWLDFYRARNDAGLSLLKHVEAVADCIIVSYQLESEFKKNRQSVILESLNELKSPVAIPRPAMFSDAKTAKALNARLKDAEKRVKELKSKLVKAIENPSAQDPVYQACQRIFHKNDTLNLQRADRGKLAIRKRALRRFIHGCPPRKKNDTSFGDAFNWEWMIQCATSRKAGLVIVSRDSDYGITIDNKSFLNDHLRQEFSERVSQKRNVLLYSRLSDALKHFAIPVTQSEVEAETEIVETKQSAEIGNLRGNVDMRDFLARVQAVLEASKTKRLPDSSDQG